MWPVKHDVLGVGISRTSVDDCVRRFETRHTDRAVVVNVCNVHSVMSARRDEELAAALRDGDINTPDGMPLVWFLRTQGHATQPRVNGVALTLHTLEHGLRHGWSHFFYGATDDTLARLTANLLLQFPGLCVAGAISPPFHPVSREQEEKTSAMIRTTKPDIVWVGLGMPKQEKWMHRVRHSLSGTVLVGIGAAFDFLAGTKRQAPAWMQQHGLEWTFRLASEPRRLWRRYAWNNPAFLAHWLAAEVKRRY